MKLSIFVFFTLLSTTLFPMPLGQTLINQEMVASGKDSFMRHCSGCHGSTAEGNGPGALMLNQKPRNLVVGLFKLRSTPNGVLPTVEDLYRTIDQGISGSAMPSFKDLSNQEKLALVAYIRSLRPDFKDTLKDQNSILISSPPTEMFQTKAGLIASAKKGRKTYETHCLSCHGDQGLGDGPSGLTLVDNDERPIKPANLTRVDLKSGKTAKDIYKAITTGLDGSPMPGYASATSDKERWELTAYIFYLRGKKAGIYTEKDTLK